MILTIKTDNPTADICLYVEAENTQPKCYSWKADRQLASQIFTKIEELLKSQKCSWQDLSGIIVFKGPGSFTGLRIGITVANSLAYGLDIPIVAEEGEEWRERGQRRLFAKENDKIALPHYGAEAHITLQKK